ncbi:ABC transporter substrate-binding protein [Nitrospirillum iridis]|uniref:ABC-type transport system substrate-binding protein/ABC-type dipeptide/oligopeptide/nickel transport system permease component n=1 Tax=Nitrospirillum iridis TaxID=765888 RepID=A0A7X0AV88_9PROT|nr:ABC transporter substrate-binding protein [Nitrospirillum iridis]MBB6250700.1 ABC-type transport system substrate-binding protein/ABC-type dipeptide/oligopeptide/nickel transport system permease component [Nitrospirillum iridis]
MIFLTRLARSVMVLAVLTVAPVALARDSLTLGMQLEPTGLDPTAEASDAIPRVVFPTVFEGLVHLGVGGTVQPLLATDWTVTADGLTYVFHLRAGVRFQDGTPFDAETVKFSLERALAPASTNPQKVALSHIDHVDVIDPLTAAVRLKAPYGSLLQVLGWPAAVMVSPASADGNLTHPVGTGPYTVADWQRGSAITLARNPAYWGPAPHLASVTYRFIADPAAATAALKAGDIQGFPAFPAPENIAALKADPRFTVDIAPSEGETLLALNNKRPPFDNVLVRRALSHAVDRQAVIQGAMFGYGNAIGSHYPPQNPGYVDLTGLYPHDIAKAKALLAEAGYPHGFTATLRVLPLPYAKRAAEIIAAQLAEAGVTVVLQDVEWATWITQVYGQHDYDMTIVAHVEPMDYDIYGRDDYYFGYSSPAYKALLARLDATVEENQRLAVLGDIQHRLADDAVNVFLFEYPYFGVWDARLRDIWLPTPVQLVDLATARFDDTAPGTAARGATSAGRWLAWSLGLALLGAVALAAAKAGPRYVAGRLTALLATVLAASLVIFLALQVIPGDPARVMMGMSADPAALAALRHQMGLDLPAPQRYLAWLAGLVRGDFGISYTYRVDVGALMAERLAVTLPLTLYAVALSTGLALALGLLAALGAVRARAGLGGGRIDALLNGVAQLLIAVPNFWAGTVLAIVFAGTLHWFSAGGFPGWDAGLLPALKALTLPAVALAAPQAGILARVLRGELVEQMGQDYIRTARAKGLSQVQALVRHALPNALVPALTILGMQFSFLLAGGIIIENVFFLPGLGRLVFQAVAQRDLIVVQGVTVGLVAAVVFVTFLVDLANAAVDPRLKGGRRP